MKTRKNVVRLNESQLQRIIKESVRKVLRESEVNGPFYWDIKSLDENDMTVDCFEESDGSFSSIKQALKNGLETLKYYNDGRYQLSIFYYSPNGAGDYTGDGAIIDNGVISIC